MPAEKSANQGRTLVHKNDKENKQKIDPRIRQPEFFWTSSSRGGKLNL